jgi:hypothetical protein
LLGAELRIAIGDALLEPGIGVGGSWIHENAPVIPANAAFHTRFRLQSAMATPLMPVTMLEPMAEARVRLSVPGGEHLRFDFLVAFDAAPPERDPLFAHIDEILSRQHSEPWGMVRAGLGVHFGEP